jgi:hypothetical protein
MHVGAGAVATRPVAAACRVAAASESSPRETAPRHLLGGAVPFSPRERVGYPIWSPLATTINAPVSAFCGHRLHRGLGRKYDSAGAPGQATSFDLSTGPGGRRTFR